MQVTVEMVMEVRLIVTAIQKIAIKLTNLMATTVQLASVNQRTSK